jgi:death-on-curing protein
MLLHDTGGTIGVRDMGGLEAAIVRPVHVHAYGEDDPVVLSCALAYAILRRHAFLDGNKRSAFACLGMLLAWFGFELDLDDDTAAHLFERLADGSQTEEDLVAAVSHAVISV